MFEPSPSRSKLHSFIDSNGGRAIFLFNVSRLLAIVGLIALSIPSVLAGLEGRFWIPQLSNWELLFIVNVSSSALGYVGMSCLM